MNRVIQIRRRKFMRNFYAINLFGFIITCRKLSPEELNHELIHSAQAKELLYLPFYIWYLVEWSILLVHTKDWMKAYLHNRFEKEAYAHQNELDYLQHRKHYSYVSTTGYKL